MADKTPLFGIGLVSKNAQITAQARVNLYAEVQPEDDKTRITFHPTPGTVLFSNLGLSQVRGLTVVDTVVYALAGDTFYSVDNNGTVTTIATITSSNDGQVSMVWTGTYVVFVDGTSGYTYRPSSSVFAQITDPDFPTRPNTVTWHDGYTIVDDSSTSDFAISDLDDPTSWNALKRASAEANPDALTRVYADRGYVILFGTYTTELWGNIGAVDFPYQRVGGGVIERGLAAKWSLAKFRDGVIGLFQNREGDVEVGMIINGGYLKVSMSDTDTVFNNYGNPATAQGLTYRHSGHSFYQINFPTDGKSWIHDADTKLWSEVRTNSGRHIAAMSDNYLNRVIVASYVDGKLYRFDADTFTDDGVLIEREIVSKHIFQNEFFSISQLWIDMSVGEGLATGQGSAPTLMLRISRDGGRSYGTELTASIGSTGQYRQRAIFRRLGRSRNFTFKLRYTDPTPFSLYGEGWLL